MCVYIHNIYLSVYTSELRFLKVYFQQHSCFSPPVTFFLRGSVKEPRITSVRVSIRNARIRIEFSFTLGRKWSPYYRHESESPVKKLAGARRSSILTLERKISAPSQAYEAKKNNSIFEKCRSGNRRRNHTASGGYENPIFGKI